MLWAFRRGEESVRIESRTDPATNEYVLLLAWQDRPPVVERYANADAFVTRLRQLDRQLRAEEWSLQRPTPGAGSIPEQQ